MTDKAAIQAKTRQLIAMTAGFCDEHLDNEERLAEVLRRHATAGTGK